MICDPCRDRADTQGGCSTACPTGCDCQHKAGRTKKDDAKSGESFEG